MSSSSARRSCKAQPAANQESPRAAISHRDRSRSPVLFISDLHLAPDRDRINRIFFRFLREEARGAAALYILGDLFDYWIGDDDLDEPLHRAVIAGLRELSDSGCRIFLMHGNRDFLIGDRFALATGTALLDDPVVVELFGTRTLLLHGDTLCIDDVAYQQFRARVRNPAVQREFLAKPLAERRSIALSLQQENAVMKQTKTDEIMDVTPSEVEQAFRAHDCRVLIHGHTHRPARHDVLVDGRRCERWVLADWHEHGEFLQVTPTGYARIVLDAGHPHHERPN